MPSQGNQFAALERASLVEYSASTQIERVGDSRVKIRGEGRLCIILGTCGLFVKHGAVSVCGAVLQSSPNKVNLYSPTSHALPAIDAQGGVAEIELESSQLDIAGHGLQSLVRVGFPDVWRPPGLRQQDSQLTYNIFGYDIEADQASMGRCRILDTHAWSKLISGLTSHAKRSGQAARILIQGAPSSGVSTFAQNLVNRLVQHEGASTGVAFVDLEATRPAFTPPGTVALQQVKNAVYGPPHTRPAANSGPLSKMHYVGARHPDEQEISPWYFDCCLDLLASEAAKRMTGSKKPMIIHAPKWLTAVMAAETAEALAMRDTFWEAARPTHVVYLGPSRDEFLASLPSTPIVITHHVPQIPLQQYDHARQADMSMQAYFHLVLRENGDRMFSNTPVLSNTAGTHALSFAEASFGEHAPVTGVLLDTTSIGNINVSEAISGRIAAVLAVTRKVLDDLGYDEAKSGIEESTLFRFEGPLADAALHAAGVTCLGFGYIQSIDEERQNINLTTPIPRKLLLKKSLASDDDRPPKLILVVPAGDMEWLRKENAKV